MKHISCVLIAISALTLPCDEALSQISLDVSSDYGAIRHEWAGGIAPGQHHLVSLPSPYFDDTYVASIAISRGSVLVEVIDLEDVVQKNMSPERLLKKKIAAGKTFADSAGKSMGSPSDPESTLESPAVLPIPAPRSGRGVLITVRNLAVEEVAARVRIASFGQRPAEVVEDFRGRLNVFVEALEHFYQTPKFAIEVRPCGRLNASSSPDVVICTELFADMADRGLHEAILPVLAHEVAHSLLFLWNLPGYSNEDMADEFAVVWMHEAFPHSIDALASYLEIQDSVREAAVQLVNGDRHTISLQRARNMRAALSGVDDISARWGRLLAPYARAGNMIQDGRN